jgi:hypothetical protein
MTTKTTLTALALAVATLTTGTLTAAEAASHAPGLRAVLSQDRHPRPIPRVPVKPDPTSNPAPSPLNNDGVGAMGYGAPGAAAGGGASIVVCHSDRDCSIF